MNKEEPLKIDETWEELKDLNRADLIDMICELRLELQSEKEKNSKALEYLKEEDFITECRTVRGVADILRGKDEF